MAATDASTEESKTEVKRDRSRSRSRDNQESTDGKYLQKYQKTLFSLLQDFGQISLIKRSLGFLSDQKYRDQFKRFAIQKVKNF